MDLIDLNPTQFWMPHHISHQYNFSFREVLVLAHVPVVHGEFFSSVLDGFKFNGISYLIFSQKILSESEFLYSCVFQITFTAVT